MDDTSEAVVEAVARAISLAAWEQSDSGTPPKWSDWRNEARAAIATLRPLIVERCAKVAEAVRCEYILNAAESEMRERIAAAIREQADVLRPGGEDGGNG